MFRTFINNWVRVPFSTLSFWSAVTFPALYIPLFIIGIESLKGLLVFIGLFTLHVIALIGGRQYSGRPD